MPLIKKRWTFRCIIPCKMPFNSYATICRSLIDHEDPIKEERVSSKVRLNDYIIWVTKINFNKSMYGRNVHIIIFKQFSFMDEEWNDWELCSFFFWGCCVGGLKSKLIAMFKVQFFPQCDRVMSFLFYFINT